MVEEKNFGLYMEKNKGWVLKDLSSLLESLEKIYEKKPCEYEFSARLDYFYALSREVFALETFQPFLATNERLNQNAREKILELFHSLINAIDYYQWTLPRTLTLPKKLWGLHQFLEGMNTAKALIPMEKDSSFSPNDDSAYSAVVLSNKTVNILVRLGDGDMDKAISLVESVAEILTVYKGEIWLDIPVRFEGETGDEL